MALAASPRSGRRACECQPAAVIVVWLPGAGVPPTDFEGLRVDCHSDQLPKFARSRATGSNFRGACSSTAPLFPNWQVLLEHELLEDAEVLGAQGVLVEVELLGADPVEDLAVDAEVLAHDPHLLVDYVLEVLVNLLLALDHQGVPLSWDEHVAVLL
eukprot:CAMPEP_0168628444 /NCGR_PEP_ID=MMETSP0449_2-20121227/11850_1 /TAXON_ID=1082188 /ORGANISM="Strombidium rassoulzadegani, Strain ras09" /LENGTH=156 /DNA_ID=CAMNT_0008670869 /DNA_START=651 /DNA_END=1123 /DNA_ORIENTATION=+